jgi:two-component system response regulator NreC
MERASSGLEGIEAFRRFKPDLVITALALPGMTGVEMIHAMREEQQDVRVLIYSGTTNRDLIRAALDARPLGFVHKTEPLEMLRHGVTASARGCSFFSPCITQFRDESYSEEQAPDPLTTKERIVLQLVAEGMSTKQIAEQLRLSARTVDHHRTQLMRKLDSRSVARLTLYAVRCGLVRV